jgi:carboxypeptidase Taq
LLEQVVALKREAASVLARTLNCSKYDALVDGYEPGVKTSEIDRLFAELRAFLPDFTREALERQKRHSVIDPRGPFPLEQQRRLGLRAMSAVGFDFEHGRLDVSHHPFCGGVPRDVRITTRYDEADFTKALMGVLHETGHAKYEQGLPERWLGQPVGHARGMSVHESQSLLQEMQVGRSREFLQFLAPVVREELAGAAAADPAGFGTDNLYKLYTRVRPGYIRVDADEVTYPAHVILRYDIEQPLIEGKIEVGAIPELWDAAMRKLLGLSTDGNFRDGCMQDVHWPSGAFGYFPTYTLGALTAAQLFAAALQAHPAISGEIARGQMQTLNDWLSRHVWSQASLLTTDELLVRATGEPLGVAAFRRHLELRYAS